MQLDYFVSQWTLNQSVYVVKGFTDGDYYKNCCLTTSALLHHAGIFFLLIIRDVIL